LGENANFGAKIQLFIYLFVSGDLGLIKDSECPHGVSTRTAVDFLAIHQREIDLIEFQQLVIS
jgi:hypothetical protein